MSKMTKSNKAIAICGGIFAAFVFSLLGFSLGQFSEMQNEQKQNQQNAPYCPTEDSCIVDYHGGKWWVIESTP